MPDPLFGRDELLQGDPTVQGLNLQTLLDRLGVKAIVRHVYEPLVLPVAIVDAGAVTLSATQVPMVLGAPASAGVLVTPAAGTVLADTGQLAAGNWDVTIIVGEENGGGANIANWTLHRRNAANTVDIWAQLFSAEYYVTRLRITLAANERITVTNTLLSGTTLQASIWTQGPF